jgi:16S rRNA (cytidine1402-2'-O)-methyltransferase
MAPRGHLFLVATPIGNLADLSERAATCLREADGILAEDTRRARKLLSHLAIKGKAVDRLDRTVESRGLERWLDRLAMGQTLAFVSDAGTPGVSDPSATLVAAASARGVPVTALPGPCAVTTALAAAGLGADRFRFLGFLPRKGRERREAIELLRQTEETAVIFEAPSRMTRTLAALVQVMPSRQAVITRELTKVHEELLRGTVSELAEQHAERRWQGELTLVFGPHVVDPGPRVDEEELERRIAEMLESGARAKEIARSLSLETGWPSREIYRRASRHP